MRLKCPACGVDEPMGFGSNYEARGRANGYAIFRHTRCGAGLRLKNPGRAMLTKRAKADEIPANLWARMSAEFDRHFPA